MSSPLPFDLEVQSAGLQRRRNLADILARQAMQPMQGQMVGQHFVPTGPWDMLSRLGSAYASASMQNRADTEQKELVGQYNTKLEEELNKYFKLRSGTPAQAPSPGVPAQELPTEDGLNFQMPENPGMPGTPAVPADPRRAAITALTSGLPALSKLGQSDLESLSKGQLTPDKLLTAPGFMAGSRGRAAVANDPSLLIPEEKLTTVNDQLYSVPEGDGAPRLRGDFRSKFGDPFVVGGDLLQNDLNTGQIRTVNPGARISIGNTTLGEGQKAGMKEWAELGAKTVKELTDGARASARTLTALNNITNSSNAGVLQGPLANFGIFLGQLANSAGMRVDANKLANSETFNSEIVRLWAEMMQANGGARGLVKEESEKMMSSLPQLAQTVEGRMQIIKVLRMKAEQDIQVAQQASQEYSRAILSQDPSLFTFGLTGTMLPSPAMDPRPGQPGLRTPGKPTVSGW